MSVATRRRNKKAQKQSTVQGLTQWKRISVPLAKLHLDLENPRHEPAPSQAEVIAWLYKNEKVEALAKDIVNERALSPLDAIGVIDMAGNPGHFIVVEGNRRLCALLLLNDPDLAPTPDAKKLLHSLAVQVNVSSKVDVVHFGSRKDAKHWIDLRHLGPQEGQGVVRWNPTQKDRAAGGGANELAVAILDRAREGKWLGTEKPPALTTLTRYLKSREVRAALGLGHHRQLLFTHKQDEVDAALRQFIHDAMPIKDGGTPKVHSRTNAKERAAYAIDFRDRGASPRTVLSKPVPPTPTARVKDNKAESSRNRPDPAKRQHLVPTGFVCNGDDKNLRMLFNEMRRTQIDGHEFANTYLLRAFIERVMLLYLRKVERGYTHKNDQDLVQHCADKLDPTKKMEKFKNIRIAASNKDASHSLHTLGAAVHAAHLKNRQALIADWGNWEDALREMLDVLSKP